MDKQQLFRVIRGRLIVSCQALEDEPLHGSQTMAKMALAAKEGGAVAIRSNGAEDVRAIREATGLPVIGLIKKNYPDSDIYITPTRQEIDALIHAGADVIALDATDRVRPGGATLDSLIAHIHTQSDCLVMADISTFEEALLAAAAGADLISTTMSGYTPYSPQQEQPDFALIEKLAASLDMPIIAEGRISTPEQALEALQLGAYSIIVGSAISRPQLITKKFAEMIGEAVIAKKI